MAAIIQTEKLTKHYGKSRGIIDVTVQIDEGEVFGFLGPNGAGKTTAIRTIMGLLKATSGSATVAGMDCWTQSTEVKKLVGYLPGEFTFDPGLTGAQIIEYLGNLRGGADHAEIKKLVARLDVDPGKKFREYSRGNKQKIGLVQAFMHKPRLLILDEPTGGLDPLVQQEFYTMIDEVHRDGRTVFLSSHVLPEVERTCGRVAIIREGKLVKVDEVAALKDIKQHDVEITFNAPAQPTWFSILDGVISATPVGSGYALRLVVKGDLHDIIRVAAEHGATNIVSQEPSLEEVFLRYYEAEPVAVA